MYTLMSKPVQTVRKLSCVYFTPEWCALCFEIIDVYCKVGEHKQEWVPTPLEEMEDDTHSNVENENEM